MKHILLSLFILAFFSFSVIKELPIGAGLPKPDIKMKDISGKSISFNDAKNSNGLLIMFSCNTCPVVIKNQERTNEICKYAKENNIGVVLLNSNEAQRSDGDSYSDMQAYAKEQDYKWYYVVDDKSVMADAFGASRTPENFLFNKEGKLVYHGAIDNNPYNADGVTKKYLKDAIDNMIAGKEITTKTSRSVGCAIKRL